MSMIGRSTAFAAEAALWIAGAAIVAGAAGVHFNVDIPIDMSSLTGPTPSPSASASPSATPALSLSLRTLAPGESPTASPLVAKYQAYVATTGYQLVAKFTGSTSAIVSGKPVEVTTSGTTSYKNGDHDDFARLTTEGTVTTVRFVAVGSSQYKSINGAAWVQTARPSTDSASERLDFAPVGMFLDRGVETKNGLQLHRLDIADPVAYSKATVQNSTSGATDAQLTYTAWVNDDGIPAAIRIDGWEIGPENGVSTKVTATIEYRIIATSGVAITAPI